MGNLKFTLGFAIAIEFSARHSDSSWNLMNVYGPCTPKGKRDFANWLKNVYLLHDEEWIILGDFNLYRFPENRNREGADLSDMNLFNNVISHLGLIDIPLQGKRFTRSNMQNPPLLEKLDQVFTNPSWTLAFPKTSCKALVMEVSDHSPLLITISTDVPKAHIFRFENFWLMREDFNEVLTNNQIASLAISDKAKILTNKCKNLRSALKAWSSNFSILKVVINNISLTIQLLDLMEEFRDLSLDEWNFRLILRDKLLSLLEQQRIYWKHRGAIKWATLGDARTKFFHANATIRHRRNSNAILKSKTGDIISSHPGKRGTLMEGF